MGGTALDQAIDDLVAGCSDPLAIVDRGPVRLLVFNRPERRNAMSSDMRRTFAAELTRAEADPAVHCLIVTGAHDFFTAGVDIKEFDLGAPQPMVRPHPVEALRAVTKPVIALVHGPCITGGLELALACTFILASDQASFADTHLAIGIFPGWGGVSLLAGAIGARRAAQMQLSGERISAQTALTWGLVTEVLPAAELLPRGLQLTERIAGFDPLRRQAFVTLNRRISDMALDRALEIEQGEIETVRALPSNKR